MNDEMEMRAKFKKRIDERLFKMMEDDLDISRAVETRYVATLALRKQRDVLEDLLHHGEISKLDAAKLRGALPALSRPPCLVTLGPTTEPPSPSMHTQARSTRS